MADRYLFLCVLLFAAACGGGGGSPAATGPTLQTGNLDGLVFEVDGQTVDRSGVRVRVLETGDVAVTGADGLFSFDRLPAGPVTLEFGRVGSLLAGDNSGPGGGDDDGGSDDDGDDDNGDDDDGDDDDGDDDDGDDDEEDEDEDDHGNPRVNCTGGDVLVRVSMDGDNLGEFSSSCSSRLRAEARLTRAPDSPDGDAEGEVEVERRPDREKFKVEVEHIAPGTVVEVFLDDPSDADGPVSIGTAAALGDGEAELERNTNDGDTLPLGARNVDELAGFAVEVRLAETGETLLTGTVPELPDGMPSDGDAPVPGGRARGKAELVPLQAGLEGKVEIRSRPEDGEQRFKMEAEHLAPGTLATFQLEDPDNPGTFLTLATATADAEGEAEISTQDGLALPAGITDVGDLVGLEVQVLVGGNVVLSGFVPALVAD